MRCVGLAYSEEDVGDLWVYLSRVLSICLAPVNMPNQRAHFNTYLKSYIPSTQGILWSVSSVPCMCISLKCVVHVPFTSDYTIYVQRFSKWRWYWGLLHSEHSATSNHHKCFYEARGNKGTEYTFTQQWHEESDSWQQNREMPASFPQYRYSKCHS